MPTYDYYCETCGPMEIFQSMRDDALTTCPECGSSGFSKQVSAGAGVIFKGSGFYETDYKRAGEAKPKAEAAKGEEQPVAKKTDTGATTTTAD